MLNLTSKYWKQFQNQTTLLIQGMIHWQQSCVSNQFWNHDLQWKGPQFSIIQSHTFLSTLLRVCAPTLFQWLGVWIVSYLNYLTPTEEFVTCTPPFFFIMLSRYYNSTFCVVEPCPCSTAVVTGPNMVMLACFCMAIFVIKIEYNETSFALGATSL